MKRFYKTVSVVAEAGGFAVQLDGRPIRTPEKAALRLPNAALAEAIAEEWRGQGESIAPLTMPLTRLANTGIDRVATQRAKAVEDVTRYGTAELMCYRAAEPPELVARQAALWQPWLDWAAGELGAPFALTTGIMHVPQDPATITALRIAVARASDLELAGLGAAVQAMGSLVLGLALWHGVIEPDAATDAALLDETFQAAKWGEDREAVQQRLALRQEVRGAGRFLTLLRDGG
jgi:chaperone required for assembly of F1-ATPase